MKNMNLKLHKLFLNLNELVKVLYTIKLRLTKAYSTVYDFHHSDIPFNNYGTKHSLHINSKGGQYFQNSRKMIQILRKLSIQKRCAYSISFQRYITCIIPMNSSEKISKVRSARSEERRVGKECRL